MNLKFRDITEDNWVECIKLNIDKENRHLLFEEFLASNDPGNLTGKKLYERFGFKDTGEMIKDELLYRLTLE